jgi:hypothetical protein
MDTRHEHDALGLLAATMGPTARAYHTGYVVRDLDRAMAVLGEAMGIRWAPVIDYPGARVRTRDGILEIPRLSLTYSTLPVHIELIQEAPGSLWVAGSDLRGHHIGVWADHLEAESARLEALGLPLHTHGLDADGKMWSFAYHETPFGLYVELVDAAAKSFYPHWFAQAAS